MVNNAKKALPPSKPVAVKPVEEKPQKIWDEDIANLQISKRLKCSPRHRRVHYSLPVLTTASPKVETYCVKVKKRTRNKCNRINVLRSVKDEDTTDTEWTKAFSQLVPPMFQFDKTGYLVPHSILGDVKEFKSEARQRGDFQDILKLSAGGDSAPSLQYAPNVPLRGGRKRCLKDRNQETRKLVKYEPHLIKSHSLNYWEKEMSERTEFQKELAGKVNRAEEELVMVKSCQYNEISKARTLIQYSMEQSKAGEQFWTLQARFPLMDDCGLADQRQYVATPELSGDADCIRVRKGIGNLSGASSIGWFKSEYAEEVNKQMGGVINVFNTKLFADLIVVGENPLNKDKTLIPDIQICTPPDDVKQSVNNVGPSLTVNGQELRWTRTPHCHGNGSACINVTVFLESEVGVHTTDFIKLHNSGSTVMKFDWKKLSTPDRFHIPRIRRQPFYFDNKPGMVLPGDTELVQILFHSPVPGRFMEQWSLDTIPRLMGGEPVSITIRGVALQEPVYVSQIFTIESMLQKRQSEQIGREIAKEFLDRALAQCWHITGQVVQGKCVSITTSQVFKQNNPQFHYNTTAIEDLRTLVNKVIAQILAGEVTSKLSREITRLSDTHPIVISRVRELFLSLDDEVLAEKATEPIHDKDEDLHEKVQEHGQRETTLQESVLLTLYNTVTVLSFTPLAPVQDQSVFREIVTRGLLCEGIDRVVNHATRYAEIMNLFVTMTAKKWEEESKVYDVVTEAVSKKEDIHIIITNKSKTIGSKPTKVKSAKASTLQVEKTTGKFTKKIDGANLLEIQEFSVTFSAVKKYRLEVARRRVERTCLKLYDEKVYMMMYAMLQDVVNKMADMFENTESPGISSVTQ